MYFNFTDMYLKSGYKEHSDEEDEIYYEKLVESRDKILKDLPKEMTKNFDNLMYFTNAHTEEMIYFAICDALHYGMRLGLEMREIFEKFE